MWTEVKCKSTFYGDNPQLFTVYRRRYLGPGQYGPEECVKITSDGFLWGVDRAGRPCRVSTAINFNDIPEFAAVTIAGWRWCRSSMQDKPDTEEPETKAEEKKVKAKIFAVDGAIVFLIVLCTLTTVGHVLDTYFSSMKPAPEVRSVGSFKPGDLLRTPSGTGVVLEQLPDLGGKRRFILRVQGNTAAWQEVVFFEFELSQPEERPSWTE